jgi:hypothetical protein
MRLLPFDVQVARTLVSEPATQWTLFAAALCRAHAFPARLVAKLRRAAWQDVTAGAELPAVFIAAARDRVVSFAPERAAARRRRPPAVWISCPLHTAHAQTEQLRVAHCDPDLNLLFAEARQHARPEAGVAAPADPRVDPVACDQHRIVDSEVLYYGSVLLDSKVGASAPAHTPTISQITAQVNSSCTL